MYRVKVLYKNMLVLCRFRDAAPSACIRQKEIGCFTYNPWAIMKVSYNRVFLPEGMPIVCYNRASFLRWIAFCMGSETKTTEAPGLRRELKARHLTMIAIGGSIGTGLLLPLAQRFLRQVRAGHCSRICWIGLMVYFLMTSLGELAAYMPVSGSFATYGQNYVEEGFGFALGSELLVPTGR